ncbi:hypothetical protein ACXR6G_20005, partial [Ancylomarina sp. YFZ004]
KTIDLTPYLNVDTKLSDSDISALGYIKDADDADADSSNEIQVLSISNDTVYLENGGYVRLPTEGFYYASCEGADNVYELTQKSITEIYEGLSVSFKANHSNTGRVYVKINNEENIELKKDVSQNFAGNEIITSQIVYATFDGEFFQSHLNSSESDISNQSEHGIIIYEDEGDYSFTVPKGVYQLFVKLSGGNGGDGGDVMRTGPVRTDEAGDGGFGANIVAILNVTQGEVFDFSLGGNGVNASDVRIYYSPLRETEDGTDGKDSFMSRSKDASLVLKAEGGKKGKGFSRDNINGASYKYEGGYYWFWKNGEDGSVVNPDNSGVFLLEEGINGIEENAKVEIKW